MKKCQVEAMFNNAEEIQKDIVLKRSLDDFESSVLFYRKSDLITLQFALAYMIENKNEIMNAFIQGDNNE